MLKRAPDYESAADRLVDSIMDGSSSFRLHDICEYELTWGDELQRIWSAPRGKQLEMLTDLQARARKIVDRFVEAYCQDEIRERAEEDAEEGVV